MYLADSLRIVASGMPEDHPLSQSASMTWTRAMAGDILERFELYAFSSSAIRMAADLRIDTPERVERIARAVLDRPRRVFVEASYRQRLDGFLALRGFPRQAVPPGRHEPHRVGVSIDCAGGGRASISAAWTFLKGENPALWQGMPNPRTRLGKEALREAGRIGTTICEMTVDTDRIGAAGLSRREFEERVSSGDADVAACVEAARSSWEDAAPELSGRALAREAWRNYRLNEFCRIAPDPGGAEAALELATATGQPVETYLEHARRDLDGEIVYALAFLAALDAGRGSLENRVRPARAPRRPDRAPVSPRDIGVDRISVVRLDLGDGELDRALAAEPGQGAAPSGPGSPRIRHPVRGHLFLARSGKMVYRRPHWRGRGTGPKITRVSKRPRNPGA